MLRFAGKALKKVPGFISSNLGDTALDKVFRIGPDLFFGGVAAVQTPGDIGDKAIAGLTQAGGGLLGGITAGGALRSAGAGQGVQALGDMFGSYAGDMAGMVVGDNLQRGKDVLMGGSGQTAWERMSTEQQAQYAQQLKQEILAQYGLMPGSREQFAQANPNLMVSYVEPSSGLGVA